MQYFLLLPHTTVISRVVVWLFIHFVFRLSTVGTAVNTVSLDGIYYCTVSTAYLIYTRTQIKIGVYNNVDRKIIMYCRWKNKK